MIPANRYRATTQGGLRLDYIGGAAYASNTGSMPSHQTGDLIFAVAFRDGGTSVSRPAGWIPTGSVGGTSCGGVMGAVMASSGSTPTGTWTNATGLAIAVYRPSIPTQFATTGGSLVINTYYYAEAKDVGSTITYPECASNSSYTPDQPLADLRTFYIRVAGHRDATNLTSATPSGWNARAGHASEVRILDAGVTVPTDGGPTANEMGDDTQLTNGSSGWVSATMPLILAPA